MDEHWAPIVVQLMRAPTALAHSVESLAKSVRDGVRSVRFVVHYNRFQRPRVLGMLVDLARAALLRGDVFHITGDCSYLALALPPRRTILTVLDCGTYWRVKGARRWIYGLIWIKLPVRRSGCIVVISEVIRQEVIGIAGVDASKVRVIHCSVLPEFFESPSAIDAPLAAQPVLLQVGTLKNKNIERLAEAISGINCRLMVIGRLMPSQLEALTRFRVNFDALERLSSAEVVECYRACDVVVFPSTSEGFGMPVIEGQACGKPVVAGDIPVLREVAGDAACFVDPLDVASIRSGIHRVLDDVSFRQDLVRLGLRNAQRFAPNTMLRGYESAYVEVARAAARRGGRGSPARSRNLTESE